MAASKLPDAPAISEEEASTSPPERDNRPPPPLKWKIMAVILVSLIRFGGAWGSGLTSAMKSTLKRELKIDNTEYALLDACQNFMATVLIFFVGLATDRFGGAVALFYGNIVFSIGSILVAAAAQVRSFQFMIGGTVIMALGDISTQIAQYQVFSSWFAPNNGFASTLGLELMIQRCGALAGSGSANTIARNTGNFAWVYWVAFFVNLFTNIACAAFYWFTKLSVGKYSDIRDPATGSKLARSTKKLDLGKVIQLPWPYWTVLAHSLFTTSTIVVFNANATELAEQRFNIDSVRAGWYTALVRYAGFFLVPLLGIVIDLFGNRITMLLFSSLGVFIAMVLVNFGGYVAGTAAAFGVFAVSSIYSPMVILDSIRTSLPEQTAFGTAYALKSLMSNSINCIIGIASGVIQDADNNAYDRVVILYMSLACIAIAITICMGLASFFFIDMRSLQFTRKQRLANSTLLKERIEIFYNKNLARNKLISTICLSGLVLLLLGGWAAFIWGAVTGNNY